MDVCAGYEPMVEATRGGGIVESMHLGGQWRSLIRMDVY